MSSNNPVLRDKLIFNGRYKPIKQIGKGSFANVYLGTIILMKGKDLKSGNDVAIKLVKKF